MKILTVCQYYYPEQFRINGICEELVKKGNSVTVLTGLPNYPKGVVLKEYKFFRKRKEEVNGVKIKRCFEIGRRHGIIYRALNYVSFMISASWKALFLADDFDLVYVYQLSPITMAIPGIIYKKIHKKPLVLYCLDLWPESITTFGIKEGTILYKIIRKISDYIYREADKIIVSSDMFRKEIEKRIKNTKEIVHLPQYAEENLKRSKIEENDFVDFVFAGNVGKAQSVETIIKAAELVKKNKKIKIHIVGDGTSLENCKKLASKLKLENVIFYGKKQFEEMQQYYDLADAMLVTLSKNEFATKTLPAKVQACMATAKPIIVAANGETPEVILKAKCGFCSEAENAKNLAENMLKFVDINMEEKIKMADNAYEYYNKYFEKDIFINSLLEIFKKEGINNV